MAEKNSNKKECSTAEKLQQGRPVRVEFDDGARLHLDRPQPFLMVHALADTPRALAAEQIAIASGAYLFFPHAGGGFDEAEEIISDVIAAAYARYGGLIVFELVEEQAEETQPDDAPTLPPLRIKITYSGDMIKAAVKKIGYAIEDANIKYRRPVVETESSRQPSGTFALFEDADSDLQYIRISIPPVYYQPGCDATYPELLEEITAVVYDAMLQGVHEFAMQFGNEEAPKHHRAYGRSVLDQATKHIDQKIDVICSSFDFLLSVTPINSEACWQQFKDDDYERNPVFRYRPLPIATDAVKRRLHAIDLDVIEDPVLIGVFREKQRELDHQLTILQLRDTDKCKQASVLVYDDVSDGECDAANALLKYIINDVDSGASRNSGEACLDCHALEERAVAMAGRYQAAYKDFSPKIEIRDDVPAGFLVTSGKLIISRHSSVSTRRVEALLNHEIGVHLVTYFTGAAQPLSIFRTGLAGYEGVQEGLGVFAEYAVGGLTPARLKLIAGRVVACRMMLDGAEFVETFRKLKNDYAFSPRAAFNIALRVHRAGGLAKDAIYMRGLLTVLEILKHGDLEPFWVGKIAPQHVPAVRELLDRGLLINAPVRPAFLDDEDAAARIDRASKGIEPHELLSAA